MFSKLVKFIDNYKNPSEVISFFESEMMNEALISDKLEKLRVKDGYRGAVPFKRQFYWWFVQMLYVGFALRGGILFMMPVLAPDNTFIPLILGDGISSLGMAVRQMWYSLCINYSFLFGIIRVTIRWAERKGHLTFMTDHTPEWGARPEQQKLRFKLNLCFLGYKYFNLAIYASIVSNLGLSLVLDTLARQSVPDFCFNLLWVCYNCTWMLFAPTILIQLGVFMWLATKESTLRLRQMGQTGEDVLKLGVGGKASRIRRKTAKLVSQFESTRAAIVAYNDCLKYIFLLFRSLFIPIAATDCYVLFTGTFPNALSRILVMSLCLNQLVVIFFYMSMAAVPHKESIPVANVIFSILVRMKDRLSLQEKIALLKITKKVTNHNYPLGYTCGDSFPFEGRSTMDFVLEVGSSAILCLQMLTQI